MKKSLTVIARIKAKTGLEDRVREVLMALVSPTRTESGCINYDLHEAAEEKGLFMFYENWTSRKDLDEHLHMPYLQSFLKKSEELLAEPIQITLWDMISQHADSP
jgi:quinol monooxygenase YgiN